MLESSVLDLLHDAESDFGLSNQTAKDGTRGVVQRLR